VVEEGSTAVNIFMSTINADNNANAAARPINLDLELDKSSSQSQHQYSPTQPVSISVSLECECVESASAIISAMGPMAEPKNPYCLNKLKSEYYEYERDRVQRSQEGF
jgi:hypothetical protein